MDKSIITQYIDREAEIKDLRKRIEDLEDEIIKLNSTVVSDSVTRGKKGKKSLGTVKITGIPEEVINKKRILLEENRRQLELNEMKLLQMQNDAEECIESIRSSELRTMLRLKAIDDLSYIKIAMHMNYLRPNREKPYTDESVRKKIERFLGNVHNVR